MNTKEKIAFYLEDLSTKTGIIINLIILGLIMLSSAIFVAQTYPLSPQVQQILTLVDTGILIFFSLEYCLRFYVAENKINHLFNIYSLIDLISILPLFLGFFDIRFLRIFRWFRFLRIFRFVEIRFFIFKMQTDDGIIFTRILLTLFSIIFIYSGLIYQVEHRVNDQKFSNFLDAFYFSIVTMTTVGFGDVTPLTQAGKLLTVLMILTGIALIPWQIGDLIKQFLNTANQKQKLCSGCGLSVHDLDANHCKICGTKLN